MDDHQRPIAAAAFLVQGVGHQLLADAALASDEDSATDGADFLDLLPDLFQGWAGADHLLPGGRFSRPRSRTFSAARFWRPRRT